MNFQGNYYRTSFDEQTKTLYADLTIQNLGQYPLSTPLYLAVTDISDPTVELRGYAGVLADGTPYYNLSSLVSGGQLTSNDSTGTATLEFYNPNQDQFTYTLELVGGIDHGPAFQSTPTVNATVGQTYSYQSVATDSESNTLSYSLVAGPSGMTISSTGLVTWTPPAGQQGTYSITLAASDGNGSEALQHYILSVTAAPPSSPPRFTSTPVVTANVLTAYQYTATAFDAGGDPLTYSLVNGPGGLSINPSSGAVTWTPTASELGPQQVTLAVNDGHGGSAQQSFLIQVLPEAGDAPPVINDAPTSFTAQSGSPFLHQVNATDPDGDPLTYSLVSGPAGMTIDPTSGLVQWTPQSAGQDNFTVQVSDGRGGIATQNYTVSVVNTTAGTIAGSVFDDLAANGVFSSGDTGLAGWVVYADLNHNEQLDTDEPSAVTNSSGAYTLSNLPPGSYDLEIVSQAGWVRTLPNAGSSVVTLAPGATVSNENFGVIAQIAPERPPILTPPVVNLTAPVGQPFSYQTNAISPEGYPLSYGLAYPPYSDLAISDTGLITWPTVASTPFTFWVRASDGHGGSVAQQINVTVTGSTVPPVITSTPTVPAIDGTLYQYQMEAQDADPASTLTYSLVCAAGRNDHRSGKWIAFLDPLGPWRNHRGCRDCRDQ